MRFECKQALHSPFKSLRVTIHPWIAVGIPDPLHSSEQATWNKPTPRPVCPAWRPSTHLLCLMYICSPAAKSQHANDAFPFGSLASSVRVTWHHPCVWASSGFQVALEMLFWWIRESHSRNILETALPSWPIALLWASLKTWRPEPPLQSKQFVDSV